MKNNTDIIIIGGGVIGLACAHYLNDLDRSVLVIDSGDIGSGASHGNCGLLHFSGMIPLCSPGVISKEIFRMFTNTSPLYIKPGLNPALLGWLLRFAVNCNKRHMKYGSDVKNDILQYSLSLFRDLLSLDDFHCDFEERGLVVAFTDPKEFSAYEKTNQWLDQYGLGGCAYPGKRLQELEPCLNSSLAGGWFNSHDWHVRPETLMKTWRKYLSGKGVRFCEYAGVRDLNITAGRLTGVITPKGEFRADAFVLAAGAWSAGIAALLDLTIPVQPGKGYSITMERPASCPGLPCLLYERNMVVTPWKSGYRLGGTMEFSGFSNDLNRARLNRLIDGAREYLTSPSETPVIEEWKGFRPMTSDDLPIIDRSPAHDNLFIASGHGMLGLTLATGTGKAIAQLITGAPVDIDLRAFSASRF